MAPSQIPAALSSQSPAARATGLDLARAEYRAGPATRILAGRSSGGWRDSAMPGILPQSEQEDAIPTRRAFTAGLAAAALAGCAPRRPEPDLAAPPVLQVSVRPHNFGDADPHDWDRRAPHRLPVHGIDVNRYQPVIDWAEARENGVNFAWIKATEGGDGLNPELDAQWNGSHSAGVLRGAFHFYYFCTEPEVQARWFIRNVPRRAGMLPPVLDLEWNPFSPTCRTRPPAEEVRQLASRFIAIIERHYGQRPMIYTTVDFHAENDLDRIAHEEFWLRSVSAHPSDRYPNARWRFWQYSGTGLVPGIAGKVDLNAFQGSTADWGAWLGRRLVA